MAYGFLKITTERKYIDLVNKYERQKDQYQDQDKDIEKGIKENKVKFLEVEKTKGHREQENRNICQIFVSCLKYLEKTFLDCLINMFEQGIIAIENKVQCKINEIIENEHFKVDVNLDCSISIPFSSAKFGFSVDFKFN